MTDEKQDMKQFIDSLTYNDAGLIPAIAQCHKTRDILMMAWMNPESIRTTLEEGRVCYYSRSRKKLWRKGEESGHVQRLISFHADCDKDCILVFVDQTGPACHTYRSSCFFYHWDAGTLRITSEPMTDV